MAINDLFTFIPEVKKPIEKKVDFNKKMKWTLIILGAFFILSNITLYGLTRNSLAQFESLAVLLGTEFGSIISLGIGPIVMSSIILQLLVGAGIMNIDTNSAEGRRYFQSLQKLGVIFFIIFEAVIYVAMGGFQAAPGLAWLVMLQLGLGGFAIMYMDEIVQKWGFGSGVSLFIVAGVARQLFTALFQFVSVSGENCLLNFGGTECGGRVLVILQSIINGNPTGAISALVAILITIVIFLVVVWTQNLKIEIPLSYEKLRGYGVKWPLQFFYASVIPVILVAALLANIQLFGSLLENWLGRPTPLGSFQQGVPVSGLAFWLGSTNLLDSIIRGSYSHIQIYQAIIYILFFMFASALFSVLWVKTSGMDEQSQAKKILSSGLQIPGFRKDERVLESILKRYIMPLTVMGGLAIGALSAFSDILGALIGGTSILLATMIMYQLYQSIAQQHAVDMHPAMRKMFGA
jgi:preprotein translocase subunit SecY